MARLRASCVDLPGVGPLGHGMHGPDWVWVFKPATRLVDAAGAHEGIPGRFEESNNIKGPQYRHETVLGCSCGTYRVMRHQSRRLALAADRVLALFVTVRSSSRRLSRGS